MLWITNVIKNKPHLKVTLDINFSLLSCKIKKIIRTLELKTLPQSSRYDRKEHLIRHLNRMFLVHTYILRMDMSPQLNMQSKHINEDILI